MKTKNKIAISLISFLIAVAAVFLVAPQGVSANNGVDVIKGDTNTQLKLKNQWSKGQDVFNHFGIKKSDVDSANFKTNGRVDDKGNVYVGSKRVATGAQSVGRGTGGCGTAIKLANGKQVKRGATSCRLVSSSLSAFVMLNEHGQFKYAIIKDCANPVTGNNIVPKPAAPKPSIKINKSVNKGSPQLGETFTYTFTARNTGATALKNVVIHDEAPIKGQASKFIQFLPAETKAANTAAINKTMAIGSNNVKITVGNLAKGASTPTYHIKAKFIKGSNKNFIKNEVCVTGQSTNANARPQNVKDCATAQNKTTDVNIDFKKTVSKRVVKVGEEFTYTITVTNKTDKKITNAAVYDVAPASIEFIEGSGNNGSTVTKTVFYKTGMSLEKKGASGATQQFSFRAKFKEAVSTDVINKACLRIEGGEFCGTDKNRTELPVELTKTVDKEKVAIGEEFTYTITLRNTTTVDVLNINMLDVVKTPDFIELIPGSGTNGLDVKNVVWANKYPINLKADETQTFTMKAKYKEGTPSGTKGLNEVCISNVNPIPPCATAENEPITPTPPSVAITKEVSKEKVEIGETFTYMVKVTNTGETDIPAANMLDAEPMGVEFIPGSATNGAQINSGDPFNTGKETMWFGKANFPLKAGETQEFQLQAKLKKDTPESVLNVVCVSGGPGISACDDAKNIMAPIEPPVLRECKAGIPEGDERCIPVPETPFVAPFEIAKTGPAAIAASVVGVSALGYGVRQWMISRHEIAASMNELYKKK